MTASSTAGVDLADLRFWGRPEAEQNEAFAALRARPAPAYVPLPYSSRGFYALVRHADVQYASRHPRLFSSAVPGATPNVPPQYAEYFGSMINMDDPRHARLRRIVARAFAPRMIDQIERYIVDVCGTLVQQVRDAGAGDFVTDVAAQLPLRVICRLVGIPPDRHAEVLQRSTVLLAGFDPEYSTDPTDYAARLLAAAQGLHELVVKLAEARRRAPAEDLVSALVHANVDGESLTPAEIGSFFILLVAAGNETTRHAISRGLLLLHEHPDQRDRWRRDPARHTRGAVEEIVRIASPVNFMRRHVTGPCELGGRRLAAGDEVRLYYRAANLDDTVFTAPATFDITREPNEHLGFGAAGPHFCLGANLARREIALLFGELLERVPGLTVSGPAQPLLSSFINGIKHLPYEVRR